MLNYVIYFDKAHKKSRRVYSGYRREGGEGVYRLPLIRFINSSRVLACWKNPVKSEVVVREFCFSTPRICMHMCCASMTTITPSGFNVSWMHSLICIVSLSCICKRRAKISTTRGILLNPVMYLRGMYATCALPKKGSMWCSQSEKKSMSFTMTICL